MIIYRNDFDDTIHTTKDELLAHGLPCVESNDQRTVFSRPLTDAEQRDYYFLRDSETPEKKMMALSAVIQAKIDQVARERDYTDGLHAATYASSTIPAWAAEGQAFVAWRDSVWVTAIGIMQACQQGERNIPTPAELLAELPVMVWPGDE